MAVKVALWGLYIDVTRKVAIKEGIIKIDLPKFLVISCGHSEEEPKGRYLKGRYVRLLIVDSLLLKVALSNESSLVLVN